MSGRRAPVTEVKTRHSVQTPSRGPQQDAPHGSVKGPAKGASPRPRPPGLLCQTCLKRELQDRVSAKKNPNQLEFEELTMQEVRVFQLKLRDWLGVERVELRPCLSRCPESGVTVEKRGKQMVLSRNEVELVHSQFDPTRQLSFFGPETE